jgi:hypothetical protein
MSLGFDLSVTPTFPNASVVVEDDPNELIMDNTGLFKAEFVTNMGVVRAIVEHKSTNS